MAYKYTIDVKQAPIVMVREIIMWCYFNMVFMKDWDYAVDEITILDKVVLVPTHIYFNNEEDLVAMKLKFGL